MSDIYGSDLIPGDVMALGTHEGIWSYMTPWGSNIHDTIANIIQSLNQDLNDTNIVSDNNDEFDIWKKKKLHGGKNSTVSYNCGCYDGEGFSFLSEKYDPSPCLISGFYILASIFMILGGLYSISYLRSLKNLRKHRNNWSFPTKMLLLFLQICFQITLLFNFIKYTDYPIPNVSYLNDIKFYSIFSSLIATLIATGVHYIENYKSYIPNSFLLFYWLIASVLNLFSISNLKLRDNYSGNFFTLICLISANSILLLILETFANPRIDDKVIKKNNPYDYANVFSKITFSWLSPLMSKGYSKFLDQNDLPPLPHFLETDKLSTELENNWKSQLEYTTRPSIVFAIAKSFGAPFLIAGIFKMLQDIIAFIQPQLLKQLILFVNDFCKDPSIPLTKGFMIVFAMFTCSILQTAALHQYFCRVFDFGIKIRSSLTSMIYQKSIVLSQESKQKKSTGDIVNLMSVDTQRLQDLVQNLQIIWSGPFQVVMCLVSLHNLIGNAMWIGVAILVVTVPLNTVIFRFLRILQKQQMKNKDERTSIISEILNNIKSLKLYGWEDPYKAKLNFVRNEKELKNLKKMGTFQACGNFIFNCSPFLVSCSTFAVFVIFSNKPLSTDIVFTSLSLFNLLGFPLAVVPFVIGNIIESQVAIKRLTDFLVSDELERDTAHELPPAQKNGDEAIKVENADFLWSRDPYKVALTNINYTAKKGSLNCIIGKVGSGKSSLLQAILGDLHKTSGLIFRHGNVAYVPQIPWIMNGTIKENILFGCRFDPVFYEQTIKACALTQDLKMFSEGDQTQVGEKGISLSGGQKARLSLARAVYARADLYLIDDALSAVDEHVGKHIVNNVLGPEGLLNSRCIVLATNNLNVLRFSSQITLMVDGKVTEENSYERIMSKADKSSPLFNLLNEFGRKDSTPTRSNNNSQVNLTKTIDLDNSSISSENDDSGDVSSGLDEEIRRVATGSEPIRRASIESFREAIERKEDEENTKKTGFEETHEKGKVKNSIYLTYAKACGYKNVMILLVCILIAMFLSVLANFWLKYWSEINTKLGYNPHAGLYLAIYFCLCLSSSIFTLIQTLVQWIFCSIEGSKYLHSIMVDSVLRAPMSFFETTPIGRILNRFSNDIYKIDENLARVFTMFFSNSIKVSFTILVIIFSTWQFVFFVIPLGLLYRFYQKYYLATSRELRRLDSVSRSPIFAHFQETLNGVATIRAYGQLDRFSFLNKYKMDKNMAAYHPSVSANRWLAVRLEFLGSIIILGASGLLIATLRTGRVTPGLVGLSVSYALQVTQSLNWIVRMTVDIESNIVSVERVVEYSELKSEAPEIIENHRPPEHWPFRGEIEFKNYSTRYRPELDLVLKNITLSINEKEKIGIVGRTGAGKSSLTLALFRIIEAAGGHIEIDNIKTSEIGLSDLRHKLSIIPQDSQVFEGTIRDNLDPTNIFTDEEIWKALELSHLKTHVLKMFSELESNNKANEDNDGKPKEIVTDALQVKLSEGGSDLSVGQRQLICLARALLIESHVLVLDEATAAVDVETDSIIQTTIRSEFKDRTILTIAHRLNTIIDSDRILVLEKGEIAEFDTPANLLKKKDSLFYSLCKEGGLVNDDEEIDQTLLKQ